jgi:isopropylmalate/homocitrate/citramalate synthase
MDQISYVSPFNKEPEVISQIKMSPKLSIVDCTLRDGEQQAGIAFTKDDKIQIAKKLDEIGIPEIEAGMPAVSEEDATAVREIVLAGLKARIAALARPIKADIDILVECGVWCATISIPIGDLQRKFKLGWNDETYIRTLLETAEYAKKRGLYVNISPYDTTRVSQKFLMKVLREIVNAGTVDRVRLVDTVGSASPLAIKYLVWKMKSVLGDIPIEIHCHDDFGMATACSIAGAEAGVEYISTTMNGVGERAGNAPTEEVLIALRFLYGIDLGVKLEKLTETSRLVEELSGVKLQFHKAVVGKHAFSHESGMVVAGVLKNNFVGEAYIPEAVGQTREILIGKKSGAKALVNKLDSRGIVLPKEKISELLQRVKSFAIANKRALVDEEFFEMVDKL